jgi:hypothetical protein
VAALRHRAEGLVAAEVFFDDGLELACDHAGLDRPFAAHRPVYVLDEVQGCSGAVDELTGALDGFEVDDDATAVADDDTGAERLSRLAGAPRASGSSPGRSRNAGAKPSS